MADSDKDILITPQVGASNDPSVVFASGATPADDITLFVTDDGTIATLSFEASSGQLFSISNDLTGIIFSVNDISGVPSIEVNADGTVSLAEFDGEVGIGTSAPTEMLTIQGRDVASSNTGIIVNSRGDAHLDLIADTNSDTELENAYVYFSQDATAVTSVIGTTPGADLDSLNGTFTGATNNGLGIHHNFATGAVDIGVNSQVGLKVDDSNNVTIFGDLTSNTTYQDVLASTVGANGMRFMNSVGTQQGYVYSDGSQTFGLLNSAGSWAVQIAPASTTVTFPGTINANGNITGDAATNITGINNITSTTMQGLGYHASSGDAAPGADVWIRSNSNAYTYFGWINTVSGSTAAVPDRIYTNSGGGDQFIRYQTVANFRTNVITGTTVAGDVTGTIGATVVGNDSHTHTFANLTSKESGTGIYRTTTNFQATNGLIGTYDDAASSSWAGPIWGMDDGFTGPTGAVNALATGTYGLRWNRASASVAHADIGEGLYVYQNGALEGGIGTAGVYSAGSVDAVGNLTTDATLLVNGTGGDYLAIRHDGTDAFIENLGTRYIDIELTTVVEARVQDSDVAPHTSGLQIKDHSQTLRDAGFNHVKEITAATLTLSNLHAGTMIRKTSTGTFTITMAASTTEFPVGSMCTVINHGTGGSVTISDGAEVMHVMDGSGTVSTPTSFVLAVGGVITIWRQGASLYYIWGAGIP